MKIIKPIFVSLLFVPLFVFAQNKAVLPNAGLTPESPFYFLDKLGESLTEFFTFNPESKARLQITFAAERMAEIKIILETKGVEAKGLEVAQTRLQGHLGDAAEIVVKQKNKGKDVSKLAEELDDELEAPKSALADSFKAEKRALEAKEDKLKAQLKAVHRAGDTAKEEAFAKELGQVKAQKELLELKEEDIDDELEAEEEKLEEEVEAKLKAEKAVREVEEEKQEVIDAAAEEGVELPANAFAEFDSLLAQAKSALAAGLSAEASAKEENFVEAKNLAKRVEKSLDQIEKTIEELEKKEEAEDDLEDVDKEIEKLKEEKERQEEQAKDEEERKSEQEEKQQEEAKDQNNEKEESTKPLINKIGESKSVKGVEEEPQRGYWQHWQDDYKPVGNIPLCPESVVIPLPIDHTKIASILYPGQYRGEDYKAHGGFRLDNLPDTKATVRIPLDAELIYGSRHTQSGEVQYLLGFRMPCGIEYRLDHLRVLEPKFQKLVDAKLPVPRVEDSRTTNFDPPIPVKAGEIIAIEVGFSNPLNVGFDFGVYDLRKKNKKAADPEWVKARGSNVLSQYAVCWFDWLSPEDEKLIRSLPAADWASGSKSDFCE